ncbi:MAG: alpha-L-fucosidase [Defluviitaleaceae bacterium]|nr:alpha-L-fucosidase [Defluviitaleaceae bacterium]
MERENLLSKREYERKIAATRDERMAWWRAARFGMFIHYGLYALEGRNEWLQALENYDGAEYEKLAEDFHVKPGACREWCALAVRAGMKYAVLTTRHHDGFSLWDSKVNPYNSMNYGSKRDIVREFVDTCREFGLKIGFYSSLMDWKHIDAPAAGRDSEARRRFTDYITELNRELCTNYGKIDILWYDVPAPMESWEGWNSLEMNQIVRSLQPHIIINNRSRLEEDFGTPEGSIKPMDRDWEACMTFNGISWGYVDSAQAAPHSYNATRIIKMLQSVTRSNGNLLLNIGPAPDGSVPEEAYEPLTTVGQWLLENGDAIYGGSVKKNPLHRPNGVCDAHYDGNVLYVYNQIWPNNGKLVLGGLFAKLKSAWVVKDKTSLDFEQDAHKIVLKNLPPKSPDSLAGMAVLALEFEKQIPYERSTLYPQLHGGRVFEGDN